MSGKRLFPKKRSALIIVTNKDASLGSWLTVLLQEHWKGEEETLPVAMFTSVAAGGKAGMLGTLNCLVICGFTRSEREWART